MAIVQLRNDTPGRAYYRRKLAAGKSPMEAIRCLKRRLSDTVYLLGCDFTAQAPNACFVGDITYLPIADGTFLYLATVMYLCSRRLVGWAVADHMRVDLDLDALNAAEWTRGSLAVAVFLSDHRSEQRLRVALVHVVTKGTSSRRS